METNELSQKQMRIFIKWKY